MRRWSWSTFLLIAIFLSVGLGASVGCGGDEGVIYDPPEAMTPPQENEPPEENGPVGRFYDHLLETRYCLEQLFGSGAVSEPPSLESFVASGGKNWDPWQEAFERYGADTIVDACGRRLELPYWKAQFREAQKQEIEPGPPPLPPPSRDDFEAFYAFQSGVQACIEAHGFALPDPPTLESFIASGAANWSPASELFELHPSASKGADWDELETDCEALGLTFDEFRDS
jgi:hypothetical protein